MSNTKNAANAKRPASGRILGTAALALGAVLVSGVSAKAGTVIVTPSSFVSSGWTLPDTRFTATAQFSSVQPRSGNGSYELSMVSTNDKAVLQHTGGDDLSFNDLVTIGTNNLGFDYYRDSTSTANSYNAPAYRLHVGSYSNQLVWEAAYNGASIANPVATNIFQSVDIKNGLFWARTNNANHAGANQTKTLSQWLSNGSILNNDGLGGTEAGSTSFDASGIVQLYSVSVGSGWGGSYKGYVDNVTFGTTTTNFENVAAAPEPSQWAGLGFTAFGALGLILKARKKKSAVSAS